MAGAAFWVFPTQGNLCDTPTGVKIYRATKKRAGARKEMSVAVVKNDLQNLLNMDVIDK